MQKLKSGDEQWQGVLVLHCDFVEALVITARVEGLIFHGYKEEAGTQCGGGSLTARDSVTYFSMGSLSGPDRLYKQPEGREAPRRRLTAQLYG